MSNCCFSALVKKW